ncbi:tol-pal system-associated acyl-CoA thioesterase [Marivivens donghaensis]|uniref:Tol-pal system-associated acyl-CoA thioesterase n=1 Tax=Marivivens donghaensis TaxID=1699413 RepID=A0ABX0VYB7_9RHOB|nr:tol-pal system-associated acyl-CoA thioesterase [Marivivens donghaensis]NIY72197.1 tol-pal system-associated acyl-CoA thioesterase [Marivivens donghaensis]
MIHSFNCRVYYEDTDLAGIVYYANYLRFIERARSEWVRARGVDQRALKETEGVVFAVRRVEADYLQPAKFDDELTVLTEVENIGGASMTLKQSVTRDGVILFTAVVTLVAINANGAPVRLPAILRKPLH